MADDLEAMAQAMLELDAQGYGDPWPKLSSVVQGIYRRKAALLLERYGELRPRGRARRDRRGDVLDEIAAYVRPAGAYKDVNPIRDALRKLEQ